MQGWLREVNWHRGTAQLHDYAGSFVRLRFSEEHAQDMQRLARRHVEVKGNGQFNQQGDWTSVVVEQITATRSWGEPFDMDSEHQTEIFDRTICNFKRPFDDGIITIILRRPH